MVSLWPAEGAAWGLATGLATLAMPLLATPAAPAALAPRMFSLPCGRAGILETAGTFLTPAHLLATSRSRFLGTREQVQQVQVHLGEEGQVVEWSLLEGVVGRGGRVAARGRLEGVAGPGGRHSFLSCSITWRYI